MKDEKDEYDTKGRMGTTVKTKKLYENPQLELYEINVDILTASCDETPDDEFSFGDFFGSF